MQVTAARHNAFARISVELDFSRGGNTSNSYYSAPRVAPNLNLATVENPPFFVMDNFPGDLGNSGGLKCDALARVLDTSGDAIEGLYVPVPLWLIVSPAQARLLDHR